MITYGEVEKLRSSHAADASVLSLYIAVPPDTAALSDLAIRAVDLIEGATERSPGTLRDEDEVLARRAVDEHAREWPGHTLGIFVSEQLALLEVVPLPGISPERAVLAARPHVRPLLAALQKYPDHRLVIIDRQHAWLFSVTADRIEVVARAPADFSRCQGFGGWYLEPSHGLQRVTELAPHLHPDAAGILDRLARSAGSLPLVVGGKADSIAHLLALLPRSVLAEYAGSFAVDPQTLTLARARELAAPVLTHWVETRERQLVQAITATQPGMPTAVGLEECLAAVNAGTTDLLMVADEPIVPGFHCERCDVFSVSSDGCCDWGAASWPVPDVLEEMVWRTLHGGGRVVLTRTLQCTAAARLR
jgi:Bacterial archaeo-eukaryotic release factor family 10